MPAGRRDRPCAPPRFRRRNTQCEGTLTGRTEVVVHVHVVLLVHGLVGEGRTCWCRLQSHISTPRQREYSQRAGRLASERGGLASLSRLGRAGWAGRNSGALLRTLTDSEDSATLCVCARYPYGGRISPLGGVAGGEPGNRYDPSEFWREDGGVGGADSKAF